jgi:uncharacterized protein
MRALLAGLVLAGAFAAPAAAQQPVDTTPTIATDGIGTVTLAPDVADFSAQVGRVGRTSGSASASVNRRVRALRRAIRAAGVADADVRTVQATVQRTRVRRRIRYVAQQTLVVHLRDVAKLGGLLDAAVAAGADVDGPEFGFADPSAARALATRAALADARKRADDAAAIAGLRITGVRAVDLAPDSDSGYDDAAAAPAVGGSGSERTEIDPGTQDVSARVRVIYTAAPLA